MKDLSIFEDTIKEDWYSGMPIVEMGKKYQVDYTVMRGFLVSLGFTINPAGGNKNRNLKHDYFSEINSAEKAYFIGFITADGSVSWRQNKKSISGKLSIEIQESDVKLLERFKQEINATNEIEFYRGCASFRITSNQIVKDLEKHGIVPNKTYSLEQLSLYIPEDYMVDYLRGLIDGDGSLYYDEKQNLRLNFISYSEDFCKSFQEAIDHLIDKTNHSKINKQKQGSYATWSGKQQVAEILKKVYYKNCIGLQRKIDLAETTKI